jgi:hypothetical protein
MPTADALRSAHQNWVAQPLRESRPQREPHWTESVAVGGKAYIERIKSLRGAKVYYRPTVRLDFNKMGSFFVRNFQIWGRKTARLEEKPLYMGVLAFAWLLSGPS